MRARRDILLSQPQLAHPRCRHAHWAPAGHQVSRRPAMTLVEVLAVVVILGLLAGVLAVSFRGQVGRAKHEIAKTNIAIIVQALETYSIETGDLPATDTGLSALTSVPAGRGEPYLRQDKIVDPWGNPFVYLSPAPSGAAYVVMSYGADGQAGGAAGTEDEDISSESLARAPMDR